MRKFFKVNVASEDMKLALLITVQNAFLLAIYGQGRITPWRNRDCTRMTQACDRITRGIQGIPGPPGIDGSPGEPGQAGPAGPKGFRGPPGRSRPGPPGPAGPPTGQRPGPSGDRGESGRRGNPGDRGDNGENGQRGRKGFKGFDGDKGRIGPEGSPGEQGPPGMTGSAGTMGAWTRCSWELNRNKDNGLLKECIFSKKDPNSVLHVVYEGNLQIGLCQDCCKRWYFIFDDAECNNPGPVDAIMSGGLGRNYPFYSYGRIEGFCERRFSSGLVRIGLQMENCKTFASSTLPYNIQLYKRYGSILIREIPPAQ